MRLETEATPEMIASLAPDDLILGLGAEFITPRIPGAEYARQAVTLYPELDSAQGRFVITRRHESEASWLWSWQNGGKRSR